MSRRSRPASASKSADPRRKHRARPTPRWLQQTQDLDEVARARCLMVLSVLSGEKPVTDAITEAQISRQLYYLLEERALRGMLSALAPGASADATSAGHGWAKRMAEMETQLRRAEQQKRRSERLLLLTRKVVRARPVTGAGRPGASHSSTAGGQRPSRSSKRTTPAPTAPSPSTPTPGGEAGR